MIVRTVVQAQGTQHRHEGGVVAAVHEHALPLSKCLVYPLAIQSTSVTSSTGGMQKAAQPQVV
jgi:hypothetical protein